MTDALACICCPVLRPAGNPRIPNTPRVCDGCRSMLAAYLTDLPALYAALAEHLEPGRGGGEIRASGFESRIPASVSPLSMLGPGSMLPATEGRAWVQDQIGDVPPLDQLVWNVEDWITTRAMRETMPSVHVSSLCAWLANRLDWACAEHDAVDEFAADLRHMVGTIRAITGGDKGERVGRCPQRLNNGTRCDTQLYVDPYVDKIVCTRCHMEWRRRDGQWLHLRGQQLAAGVETVEAA